MQHDRPYDPEGNETRALHELVDFRDKDVLDIGCGDGRMTWRYADLAATVIGLDLFEGAIVKALAATPDELRSQVRFRCEDALTAELEPSSFDVVVFSRSI